MSTSIRKIINTMDSVASAQTVKELAKMHQWVGDIPSPLTVRQITNRHENPDNITVPLLFYNTYLMPGLLSIARAPAIEERAREIGAALQIDERRYGNIISVLCEVWKDGERGKLLSAWPITKPPRVAIGADAGNLLDLQNLGSGLVTVASHNFSITRSRNYIFDERGSKTSDADHYANKGILLAEIDVGFESNIEIYNTHLLNGGILSTPPDAERFPRQRKQLNELVNFFRRNHKAKNVAIIAGDFNISATSRYYQTLRDKMRSIDLEDIWALRNGTRGDTNSFVDKLGICRTSPGDSRFCDDDVSTEQSSRIDYIFMQQPNDEHRIYVDFTRPRRRPFWRRRGAPDWNEIRSMSDHLGIETNLIISQK